MSNGQCRLRIFKCDLRCDATGPEHRDIILVNGHRISKIGLAQILYPELTGVAEMDWGTVYGGVPEQIWMASIACAGGMGRMLTTILP